ncbi:MAG: DUF1573 domain-containing protein [Phycisphaerales bacterium]
MQVNRRSSSVMLRQMIAAALVAAVGTSGALAQGQPATPPAQPPAQPAQPPAQPDTDTGLPVSKDNPKDLIRLNEKPTGQPTKPEARPAGAPFVPPPSPGSAPVSAPLPQGKGLLTFEQTTHDFGKVFDTTPRKWMAKFKNTGTEKLTISAVRPGCGCTAAALSKYDYEPGEEGAIELTWNPTGIGEVTKPVTVTSNDMNEPNKVINVKATMVPLVKLDPMFLQGGTIQAGNERPMRLSLQSRDKEFTIKSVEFDNNLTMAWKEVPDETKMVDEAYPGRKALEFMIPKDAPVGSFMRGMNITVMAKPEGSSEAVESKYNVRAFANIVGDLMATPAYLTVAGAKPQTAFESSVTVTSRSGKPFEIKSAEVIDVVPPAVAGLVAKAEALPENKGWKITLSGNPGTYVGAFRGSVRLLTSLGSEGPTVIPFSGMSMQAVPTAPTAMPTPATTPPAVAPTATTPDGKPIQLTPVQMPPAKPGAAAPGGAPTPAPKN